MQLISVLLNIVLLVGVIGAIALVMKSRKQPVQQHVSNKEPDLGNINTLYGSDDIISVRKTSAQTPEPSTSSRIETDEQGPLLMLYLVAEKNSQFVGYELLQALLSNGMRFGNMSLFHRHQEISGKGPVLFSLANASEEGTFEIQKMGAFCGRGLCLYMHLSGNCQIDTDRFQLMLSTAKELAQDLNAKLLDDKQQSLGEESLERYHSLIDPCANIQETEESEALV